MSNADSEKCEEVECPKCNGKGKTIREDPGIGVALLMPGVFTTIVTCNKCKGTGKVKPTKPNGQATGL